MLKLNELRAALGVAVDQLVTLANDEAAYTAKEAEITRMQGEIERLERAQTRQAALASPVGGSPSEEPGQAGARENTFRNFGEQLMACVRYADPSIRHFDPRLVRAPQGSGEVDASSGGFLVQTDFATEIFKRAYATGEILSRTRKLGISTNANSIKIPAVDEKSRATGSRWGGVQSYWVGEGSPAPASKPKFRLVELDLKKLMSTMYVTDELLQDAAVLSSIANEAFAEEVAFMTEDSMVRGTGAGQPLGILNSPCRVTVNKEAGQAAKTIVYPNVLNMWSRMWARSRKDAVWYINQDIEPQLYSLSQVIGTAGVPVYLPANGISGQPYGTLFGRPVVPVEYCESLGTEGDLVLADFGQYVLADKGGVQAASSMHVAFLTDEMTFRITYRVDGEPIWNAPLTPYKGANTLSPFVTLQSR
jgi:HK97 family phage major capsid protein